MIVMIKKNSKTNKHLLLQNYNFNLFILLHAFDNENVHYDIYDEDDGDQRICFSYKTFH